MIWFLTKTERQALARVIRMSKINPRKALFALILGAAGMGAAVALSATSAWLIARASQHPPVLELTVAAVSVRFFGISRAVLRYLQRLASHKVALKGMDSLRLSIYDALEGGPIERIARLQRGDLLARTGADVDTVGDLVVKSLLPTAVTVVVGVATVTGFAFLSIPAALVLAAALLVSGVFVPLLTMHSTRMAEIAEQDSKRDLAVEAMTIMEGADELLVDGRYRARMDLLQGAGSRLNQARARAARPAAFAAALDRMAMGFSIVGVFIVATPATNAGMIAAVALAVLVLTPLAAFEGTAELAPAAAQVVRSAQAAVRITDLLGPEEVAAASAHDVPARQTPLLRAEDLSVGWPQQSVVAGGITLEVRPGSKIAVVGPSGIGKTTLLYTLAGMLEPKAGTVSLNGSPIWHADREQSSALVSLTTEDAHVFATSVFENLRVANSDLTTHRATELLQRMGLGLWLTGLPQGLETQLGAGGTSISGGERRRLLLARALASPAPLMLLDEPGEHLDTHTADLIVGELLRETSAERGVLLVTHRLSGLTCADQIFVVNQSPEGARVVACGTHQELVESSAYYRWSLTQEE